MFTESKKLAGRIEMTTVFNAAEASQLPKTSGAGKLRMEKGVYILNLEGTYAEMGAQMGDLSHGIIDDYMIHYFYTLTEKLVAHSAVSRVSRILPSYVSNMIYKIFLKRSLGKLDVRLRDFIVAMSERLGTDSTKSLSALYFADILHYLAGKSFVPMAPQCSAFFSNGAATQEGKIVMGRNFDFYGRNSWNSLPAITVMKPLSRIPFMWLGALGLPFGGMGINREGIAVCPFSNFTSDICTSGRPIIQLCYDIMDSAKSLDDAEQIVRTGRRLVGLSFMVVDTKNRDARVVGFSANNVEAVDPEDDFLIRTNHYVTEPMKKMEVSPRAVRRHTYARFSRLEQLIRENYGSITPQMATSFMSDVYDPFEGRRRVVGDILAASNNAMSMIFSPDDGEVFMATGDFPVANADTYFGFSIDSLFDGAPEAGAGDLDGGHQLNETEKQAVFHFEEAWSEYFDRMNDDMALYHLRRAADLLPDEPIFHRMAGTLLLTRGKFQDARRHFEINAAPEYRDKGVRSEALLWAGRANDLCGDRDRAISYYNRVMEINDPEINAAARKGLVRPFKKTELLTIEVEFIIGGPIAKYA